EIYGKRKIDVEPVFGFLKANLGFTRMSVRGKPKVHNEMGFALMAVNLRKYTAINNENGTFSHKNKRKNGCVYLLLINITVFVYLGLVMSQPHVILNKFKNGDRLAMKKMWKKQPVIWLMLVAMIFQLFPQMMGLGYVNAEIQDEGDIGENLVIYPSYEEDVDFEPHVGGQAKVGNWFYYGEGVERIKNEPHSGDYAARLSSTSDALEQDIQDLQMGETYKLSVWAKNTNPDKTSAYIVLKNYGGNEKQLKIDSSEYEQYEAQFVFTGDKDDMPRIAAWVEESSEGEVYVDDWELVSEGSDITDLNIENGLITVDFDENYQGNITKNDFQATYFNSTDSGNVKELPIVSESVSDNTLMMEYTAFEKKPIEQEITVNLQYMPDNQSTAINYSLEFT